MKNDKSIRCSPKNPSKKLLTVLVASTLLISTICFETAAQEDVTTSESEAPISNRTEQNEFGSTTSNQSGLQTDSQRVLSKQGMKPVIDSLFKAREELLQDNIVQSFEALNTASSELLKANITQESNDDGTNGLTLVPLQRQIEFARSSLLLGNNTLAILHLNAADTEFIKINQELPTTDNVVPNIVNETLD